MSASITWIKVLTKPVRSEDPKEPSATDRQERVPGFDQARFSSLGVALIGAGGLNGETAEGLVRKGVGCLKIYDPDHVDLSNLSRQRFFARDLGENKAWALVRNLEAEAVATTWLKGCALSFEDAVGRGLDTICDVGVCGVDNNRTRIYVSRYFAQNGRPLVLTGVSNEADHGYVFVQVPGGACFGCVFPDALESLRDPCPNTPAVKDILKVIGGYVLYAVDSLVMPRRRRWNYKQTFLDGAQPERCLTVPRRSDCGLCAGRVAGR
jgi:molybdopterin/thiamine biosynthesis adenylyltransferase